MNKNENINQNYASRTCGNSATAMESPPNILVATYAERDFVNILGTQQAF